MSEAAALPHSGAKLWLIDDHGVVHFGLKLLAEEEGCTWLEGARTPAEAVARLSAKTSSSPSTSSSPGLPDVIILDLVLGGRDRLDLLGEIRRLAPEARIIVYSSLPEETYAERVFRHGAWAFVPKSGEMDDLRAALRAVLRGEIWARPAVLRALSGAGRPASSAATLTSGEALSDRELHVYRLLGEGKRPRTIAEELHLSVKTVHTYCERLKIKLGCSSLESLQQRAAQEREW